MLKTIARFAVTATFSGAAAFAALSVPFLPAHAAVPEVRSVRVSYADLDLASKAGVATLERRIRAAARSVCGVGTAHGLAADRAARACMAEALDRAAARA